MKKCLRWKSVGYEKMYLSQEKYIADEYKKTQTNNITNKQIRRVIKSPFNKQRINKTAN